MIGVLLLLTKIPGTDQGSQYGEMGSEFYLVGLAFLLLGIASIIPLLQANGWGDSLPFSDKPMITTSIIALLLFFVFQAIPPLRMFVFGLTVAIIPAIGIFVIYLLMEVPTGS
jgi:hypothetical protein